MKNETMEALFFTEKWMSAVLTVSKALIVYALVIGFVSLLAFKSSHPFYRGAFFPLVLLAMLFLVYGGNTLLADTKSSAEYKNRFQSDKARYIAEEQARVQKLRKSYRINTIIWIVVIVAGSAVYLAAPQPYFKGLGVGLLLFGVSSFITDATLNQIATDYQLEIGSWK